MKKLLVAGTLLALAACGQSTATEGVREDGVTELRIGLVAGNDDPDAGRASEEFTQALSEALGVNVIEIEGMSHLIGIESMRAGALDVMMASPFTYQSAVVAGIDIEFLASLDNPDAAHNNTVIITGAENTHINTLADFEGETFAFVDTASLSGFLNPMYLFVSTFDLDHTRTMMLEPGYFFSNAITSGGHDASLMAVVNGDVAGAAVGSMIIGHMLGSGIISEDEFRIVYELQPDPNAGYLVRSDLPQTLIDDLRDFLLNFDDESFFANIHNSPNARFVETNPADFAHLSGLMERLEIGSD